MIKSEYPECKKYLTVPAQIEETEKYIRQICRLFQGKEVWFRTNDATTAKINVLEGYDVQIDERNPHIGLRGIRRSITFPDTFKIEVIMIEKIRKDYPCLNLFFPFVSDPSQIIEAKKYLAEVGYSGKLGMMAEIPSTVLCIDEYLDLGVTYVVVGINDLSDLIYGSSRKENDLYPIVRDSKYTAAIKLLKMIFTKKRKDVEYALGGNLTTQNLHYLLDLPFDNIIVPYNNLVNGKFNIDLFKKKE